MAVPRFSRGGRVICGSATLLAHNTWDLWQRHASRAECGVHAGNAKTAEKILVDNPRKYASIRFRT